MLCLIVDGLIVDWVSDTCGWPDCGLSLGHCRGWPYYGLSLRLLYMCLEHYMDGFTMNWLSDSYICLGHCYGWSYCGLSIGLLYLSGTLMWMALLWIESETSCEWPIGIELCYVNPKDLYSITIVNMLLWYVMIVMSGWWCSKE